MKLSFWFIVPVRFNRKILHIGRAEPFAERIILSILILIIFLHEESRWKLVIVRSGYVNFISARYGWTECDRIYLWRCTTTGSMATWKFHIDPMCIQSRCYYGSGGLKLPFFENLKSVNIKMLNRIRRQSLLMYKNGSKPISSFLSYSGKPMDDFYNCNSLTTKYLNKSFILKLLRGREKITKIISLLNKCKTL